MDRYTYLYGTNLENTYCALAYSDRLPEFLKSIGATSSSATIEAARKYVNVHNKLYIGSDKILNTDVSICYLPMYLRKLPHMPDSLKPFCAVGISGRENLQGRDSFYDKTVFIPMEYMLESVEENGKRFTYLDQIFGTHLLSWQEVKDHRLKIDTVNCNELPETIEPKLHNKDFSLIVNTIKAIFDGKAVIIRLEDDCAFNERAKQVLTQIYSLLYPALAMETGFAAVYVDQKEIARLRAETSVRIFVVPAAFDLATVPDGDVLKLDLENPAAIPVIDPGEKRSNKLTRSICQWANLNWTQRQEAMEVLFRHINEKFLDPNEFIYITESFFNDSFFTWIKEKSNNGSVASLEELKQIYDRFPICNHISWTRKMFAAKILRIAGSQEILEKLVSEQYADFICGDSKAGELAAFGLEIFGQNLERTCLASARRGHNLGIAKGEEERIRLENELAVKDKEKEQAIDACEKKLAAKDEEKEQAIRTTIDACEKKRIVEVNAEAEKTRQVQADYSAFKVASERKINELNTVLTEAEEEKNRAVKETEEACEARRVRELSSLRFELEREKATAVQEINNELRETRQALDQSRKSINMVEADKSRLRSELQLTKNNLQSARREMEKAISSVEDQKREAEAILLEVKQRENALYRKENELRERQNSIGKRQIVSAAIGFAGAVVIFCLALLIRGFFINPADEETAFLPEPTADVSPELSMEPTPEVTEKPEETQTPAPTVSQQEINETVTAESVAQDFPNIAYTDTEMLPSELAGTDILATYQPVAIFSLDERTYGEEGILPDNYVLWAKRRVASGESENVENRDAALAVNGPEFTVADDLEARGVRLILSNDKDIVCAYGNDEAVNDAIGIFSHLSTDEHRAELKLYDKTGTDIAQIIQQATNDYELGRNIVAVSTENEYLQRWKEFFSLEAEPVIYMEFDPGFALVFEVTDSEIASTYVEQIDPNYSAYYKDRYIVII